MHYIVIILCINRGLADDIISALDQAILQLRTSWICDMLFPCLALSIMVVFKLLYFYVEFQFNSHYLCGAKELSRSCLSINSDSSSNCVCHIIF